MRNVPWQIWVVVGMLVFAGIGDLFQIPETPQAIMWLLAKCLFITGLLKGWKWVFVLFLVIAAIHVLYFLFLGPVASFLNLILIVLTLSAYRFYFPLSAKSAIL